MKERKYTGPTEVCMKAKELLYNELEEGIQRCVIEIFLVVDSTRRKVWYFHLAPRLWEEHLISIQRCVVAVMQMVGYLPAEVWGQQCSVDDLRRIERLVIVNDYCHSQIRHSHRSAC